MRILTSFPPLGALLLLAGFLHAQDTFGPEHLERALALHRSAIVLDTHSDTTPRFEEPDYAFDRVNPEDHMDLPRMREGGFNAQFWSIYMGRTPGDGRAIKTAIKRIDSVHQMIRRHPDQLALARTAADIRRIHREGRIACLMGVEGGHIIEDSLAALRMFERLGCRYMTLTHSFNTSWADAAGISGDTKGEHGGLTAFGREIVREMNRIGMMVDVSHVADSTFYAALETTRAPVILSHSSTRAIRDHRRNPDDAMLRALKKNGGVLMINFYSGFIEADYDVRYAAWEKKHQNVLGPMAAKYKANRAAFWNARKAFLAKNPVEPTPLVVLARHVEHAAKVMGWEHVGIGADWDGVSALPKDMEHCGKLPNLTALLLARGATEEQLRGFLGENLLRVMEECERVASRLSVEER